jgi:hypothetical protein
MLAERARESTRSLVSDAGQIAFAERMRQVFPDVGKRPIHTRRQIARRVGKIAFAVEHPGLGFAAQGAHDRHEELDPPNAMAIGDLGEERKNLPARALAKEHASPRKFEKGRNRADLGEGPDGPFDEFFVELDESAAQRHGLAVWNVADPVVRQVGAGRFPGSNSPKSPTKYRPFVSTIW